MQQIKVVPCSSSLLQRYTSSAVLLLGGICAFYTFYKE